MRNEREPNAYQPGLKNKSNRYGLLLCLLLAATYGFAGITYRTTITVTYDDKDEPVTTFLNDMANQFVIDPNNGSTNDTLYISDGDTLFIDNVVFDQRNFLLPMIIVIEGTDDSPGGGGTLFFIGGKGELKLNLGSDILIDPDNKDGILFTVGGGSNQGNGGPNTVDENVVGGNTLITIGDEKISVREIKRLIELGSLSKFLPVELVYFRAQRRDGTVVLSWQTAWELDNDYFEVEQSKDGRRFTPVARIKGRGTTDNYINYQYIHVDPSPGVGYYRLRQVDFDGSFAYSPVVAVAAGKDTPLDFVFAPNPAREQVEIRLPQAPATSLRLLLTNSLGQTRPLSFDQLGDVLRVRLPEGLPAGLYWLQVQTGTERASKAVMIR